MDEKLIASREVMWPEGYWWRPTSGPQMRAVGVWPEFDQEWALGSPAPPPQDAFWIEATPPCATEVLLPLSTMPQQNDLVIRDLRRGMNGYFLITRDRSAVIPHFCYFPMAGQWDGRCPILAIIPAVLNDLEELADIRYTLRPEGTRESYQMSY